MQGQVLEGAPEAGKQRSTFVARSPVPTRLSYSTAHHALITTYIVAGVDLSSSILPTTYQLLPSLDCAHGIATRLGTA